MQTSDERHEQEAPRNEAGSPAYAPIERRSAIRGDGSASGAAPDPTELFLLDYDRELVYLAHEGKLRRGRRPTGFKP